MTAPVIIVGAGMAGIAAARRLAQGGVRATVIDPGAWFEWLPNIHELVSGRKSPGDLRLPRAALLRAMGHRFLQQRVVSVAPEPRTLTLDNGQTVHWSRLILACGGEEQGLDIPGVRQHAFGFKSVDQCHAIGERLCALMAAPGSRTISVVIVGGGIEGVEATGEVLRRYRGDQRLQITLLEGSDRLMPSAPAALDLALRNRLAGQPVTVRDAVRVTAVSAEGVTIQARDGATTELMADLVVWTGGTRPPSWLAKAGLADERGWGRVTTSLASPVSPHVWLCGDAARLPGVTGKQAADALAAGLCAAENLIARRDGRAARAFRAPGRPQVLTLGDLDAWLIAEDHVLSGPLLGELKEVIYQFYMRRLDSRKAWRAWPAMFRRLGGAGMQRLDGLGDDPFRLLDPRRYLLQWHKGADS